MRKWNVLAAVAAVALVAPVAFAQPDDFKKDLQEMKARLTAVEAENAALKAQVNGQDDQALESQISSLAERYAAGTTVKSAANPVTLSGEFRFRNSWSFGDNRAFPGNAPNPPGFDNEHDGSWVDSIIRLGVQYDFTRDVTAFAELQARWAFGDGATTAAGFGGNGFGFGNSGTSTPVVLHQGWLEVRNIFNRPEFSSRTGRQEIVLGNQYQFGNADWYNGYSFDATRWDWDSESFSLTGIVGKLNTADGDFNQNPSFKGFHDDDELYTLYFTLKTIKNHALDIYWIYVNGHGAATGGSGYSFGALGNFLSGSITGDTVYFHTIGARIGGVFPDIACGLDWNLEGAYQFGDEKQIGGGNDRDIDAFSVEAELGLTFNKDSKFRIFGRFLWAEGPSGNDNGWTPLYPNRHSNGGFRARYGQFDLIPMTNVITVQLGLHFDPDPCWTLGATGLWAGADNNADVLNIGTGNTIRDDDYGWEIDVWGEYRYSDHLVFNAGISFVFADNALEDLWLIDDDTQFYGYIQARLNF